MKRSKIEGLLNWLIELATAAILCMLLILFVAQVSFVRLDSMLPTLHNDDVIIVDKITPRLNLIARGDIVTLKNEYPTGEDSDILIKRVIGIGGDAVEIRDGKVFVNGIVLKEGYSSGDATKSVKAENSMITVPAGSIYVLGDNRLPGASYDSRSFGTVKPDQINGKALFRIFPFNEIGLLK